MDHAGFDQVMRSLSDRGSRRSLLHASALGALGLGLGLAAPHQATANKHKHKRKKSRQGDANALCKTQVAPCTEILALACGANASCVASVRTCCPRVATCDFDGFLTCLEVGLA